MVNKGSFVRVKRIVLDTQDRSQALPDSTKKTPLIMWTKGYLLEDAKFGDMVEVLTLSNRKERGELIEVDPTFDVNYGQFVPEILKIGRDVKGALRNE